MGFGLLRMLCYNLLDLGGLAHLATGESSKNTFTTWISTYSAFLSSFLKFMLEANIERKIRDTFKCGQNTTWRCAKRANIKSSSSLSDSETTSVLKLNSFKSGPGPWAWQSVTYLDISQTCQRRWEGEHGRGNDERRNLVSASIRYSHDSISVARQSLDDLRLHQIARRLLT